MRQSSEYQTSVALVPMIAPIYASFRDAFVNFNPIIYTTLTVFDEHLNKGLYS